MLIYVRQKTFSNKEQKWDMRHDTVWPNSNEAIEKGITLNVKMKMQKKFFKQKEKIKFFFTFNKNRILQNISFNTKWPTT